MQSIIIATIYKCLVHSALRLIGIYVYFYYATVSRFSSSITIEREKCAQNLLVKQKQTPIGIFGSCVYVCVCVSVLQLLKGKGKSKTKFTVKENNLMPTNCANCCFCVAFLFLSFLFFSFYFIYICAHLLLMLLLLSSCAITTTSQICNNKKTNNCNGSEAQHLATP